jgi:dynein heavy chain, axonemal
LQLHTHKLEKFYTLSRKGITTYQNDEPSDYITLTDWLIERNYYQEIRGKPFFHEFRRWKVLRMWRRNILHKRREEVRTNLSEKLFFLDPVFCPVILQHRRICKEIENHRLVNLATGVTSASGSETLSLQEFKKN